MPELSLPSKFFMLISSGSVIGLFFKVLPIAILVAVVYAIYRCLKLKIRAIPFTLGSEIARWVFVCYLTGLICLLFVPQSILGELYRYILFGWTDWEASRLQFFTFEFNLIPTAIKWLNGEITIGSWVKTMLLGNLLMFVPMGVLLPIVIKKVNHRNIFAISFFVPVAIEVLQPIVGRSFDIDDILMNFSGILIGYCLYSASKKFIKTVLSAQKSTKEYI